MTNRINLPNIMLPGMAAPKAPAVYFPPPAVVAKLLAAWHDGASAEGGVRLVLVLGQDGVGKTALLTHLAAQLRADPAKPHVLQSKWSADEFDPFAPFLDALGLTYIMGQLVPGIPKKPLHWMISLTIPEVPFIGGILAGEVAELLDKKPVASDPNTMTRMRQQIADSISRRARNHAVAFLIEDLQYAGEAGIELLGFLVGALRALPVVFFVSLRTAADQPDTLPADIAARLNAERRQTRVVPVPPLDDATAGQLLMAGLKGVLPDATIQAIRDEAVDAAGGVPRHLLRLTERLGTLSHLDAAGLRNTVREFARNNLNVLSEKEKEILQMEAVMRATLPEAAYAVVGDARYWDLSERDLRRYLPKLDNFLSESLFDAVYSEMDPTLRTGDHLHCAQVLERAYGDTMPMAMIPQVAYHYAQAGNADRAGRYYLQAGLALTEQNMNEPAREQLERARSLFATLGADDTLAEIDYLLGWTRYKLGDLAPAKRDLHNALAAYDRLRADGGPSDPVVQARRDRAQLLIGVITAVGEQHYDQAVGDLEAVVGSSDDRVRALAQITLGYCLYRKDPAQAETLARAGLAEARHHSNPFTIAQALQYLAIILKDRHDDGLLDEAIAHLEEAARYAEADKYLLAQIYNTMGDAYAGRGDDATAIDYLQRSLALKQEIGDEIGQAFSYGALGRAYRRIGRLDDALACFRRDLALIQDDEGQEGPRILMHCLLADVQRLRGDYEGAMAEVGGATQIIDGLAPSSFRQRQEAFCDLAAAQIARAIGQPQSALDGVHRARAAFEAINYHFMLPECDLAEGGILRDLGDLAGATTHLQAAGTGTLDRYDAAWLAWEQAMLARAGGDYDAAGAHLAAALDLARELHNPWLERKFTEV